MTEDPTPSLERRGALPLCSTKLSGLYCPFIWIKCIVQDVKTLSDCYQQRLALILVLFNQQISTHLVEAHEIFILKYTVIICFPFYMCFFKSVCFSLSLFWFLRRSFRQYQSSAFPLTWKGTIPLLLSVFFKDFFYNRGSLWPLSHTTHTHTVLCYASHTCVMNCKMANTR